MLTCPCNENLLTPHFYIVKLGFTGVYIIFALKYRLWKLVRTASSRQFYRVPTIYVLSKNMKIVKKIELKIVIFTAVKNRCMLHGHVFVMMIYFRLLTGGCLLLHENSAESSCSDKQPPVNSDVCHLNRLSLKTGLTVISPLDKQHVLLENTQ